MRTIDVSTANGSDYKINADDGKTLLAKVSKDELRTLHLCLKSLFEPGIKVRARFSGRRFLRRLRRVKSDGSC